MRGLIRNNLYAMESNIILAFILSAFLAVSSLLIKSSALILCLSNENVSKRAPKK